MDRTGRAVGYLRTEHPDGGPPAARQRTVIEDLCATEGLELVDVHTDYGYRGYSLVRPGLARATARLRDGTVDTIVAMDESKVTQDGADLAQLWTIIGRPWGLLTPTANSRFSDYGAHHPHVRLPGPTAHALRYSTAVDPNLLRWAIEASEAGQSPAQIAAALSAAQIPINPRSTRTDWRADAITAALRHPDAVKMRPVQCALDLSCVTEST